MRKFIYGFVLGLLALFGTAAVADYTIKDGNTTTQTVFAFVCATTKICPAHVLIKSDGTEIGTTSNPVYTGLRDAAGNNRGANVNASNQLTVSVDAGAAFNANGRNTSANSGPMVQPANPTTWHLIAANSTNATSVKGSAATLFSCQLGNIGSTVAFLKIYNKASAPTVGSDTPVKTLIIPKAGTAADGAGNTIFFGPGGLALGTGFAAAVTAGIAVADTTAVAAANVAINCDYE